MTTKQLIFASAALLAVAGCVRDPIYHTPHPRHAQITVISDWSGSGEGVAVPSDYTVAVGEAAYKSQSVEYTIPDLFDPGDYTLYLYNEPENIIFAGTTAHVTGSASNLNPMPGWLFTGKVRAAVEKDRDYEFPVRMTQQVGELTLIVDPAGGSPDRITGITGILTGVAGSYDLASGVHADPSQIPLTFTKIVSGTDAGKWRADVRLLGITGDLQLLSGTIAFRDGSPADMPLESDLSDALRGFNDDKSKPVVIGGTAVETQTLTGFSAVIEAWSTTAIDAWADMPTVSLTGSGLESDLWTLGIDPLTVRKLRIADGELSDDDFAFMRVGLPNLTELDIKAAANDMIPERAFENHRTLRKIIVPEILMEFGDSAFSDCTALESVTCHAQMPPLLWDSVFDGCPLTVIEVPAESVDDYKAEFGWDAFANIITAIQ